tara:strand:- start:501 stop:1271 length:771 start_codon:yes stop_codon:yes gene_type:complete
MNDFDENNLYIAYHIKKILEPKSKKNEDILLFNLMKIADLSNYKVKDFTDKYKYKVLKEEIFLQFNTIEGVGVYDTDMFEDNTNNRWIVMSKYKNEIAITHPNQALNSKINPKRHCPCSKTPITYHCVIKHSYNDSTCWVGNSCIKKFLPHLKKQLAPLYNLATKLKNKHISLCDFCNAEIEYGRMFCNNFCNMSFYTGFVSGKYKGEMIRDVVKNDYEYIQKLNNCNPRDWEKNFGLFLHNDFDWNLIKIIKKLE